MIRRMEENRRRYHERDSIWQQHREQFGPQGLQPQFGAPQFTPQHGPQYGPQYAPQYGPQYGPQFGPQFGGPDNNR